VVIVLASQGFITLEAGIALAFGANIGTCVTAMLAAIGKPREAVRAAVVHVIFNIIGVLLWIGLIDQLAELVTMVSPSHPELEGIERLGAETPRQIANAHTMFNITNTLVCIGFVSYFARAVERLVPDTPIEDTVIAKARYLDLDLIETPSLALNLARMEISSMATRVRDMLERIVEALLTGDREAIRDIASLDDEVDVLHQEILLYLGEVSKRPLSESQGRELFRLMSAADRFESMGDVIETDLADLGERRIDSGVKVSDATADVLKGIHAAVLEAVELSVRALKLDSQKAARQVLAAEVEIQRLLDHAARHQAERLVADEPNRLPLYTIETEAIDRLRRVYFLAQRTARGDLPASLKRASLHP
jgi:phosphate:Na+ symporter